jgi:two-component system response regulator YesN
VAEVAVQVGYADPNYFSRVFKKMTNQTPSAYRDKGKLV